MTFFRGCLLYLAVYLVTSAGYVWALSRVLEWPAAVILGLFGALLLGVLASSIYGFISSHRDRARLARAMTAVPPRDGERIAAAGVLVPDGAPVTAPFSGQPAVLYDYEIERESVLRQRGARPTMVKDWNGVVLAPCLLRTATGDLRVLAVPDLEHVTKTRHNSPEAFDRAAALVANTPFVDLTLANWRRALASLREVLADSSGGAAAHWRHGQLELDPADHRLSERVLPPGSPVCLFGRYSATQGGIVGGLRWGEIVRLYPGDLETASRTLTTASWRNVAIAGLFFAVLHGMIAFALMVTAGELATPAGRAARATDGRSLHQLMQEGDSAAIRAYAAAGGDLDVTDSSGSAAFFSTGDSALKLLLLELGASPNARDHQGDPLLDEEVREGDLELVERLLAAGVDLEARNSAGSTALDSAIRADRREAAALLSAAGAVDFRVREANGQPLPPDGGPPFGVYRAYLAAIHAGDPTPIAGLVAWETSQPTTAEELSSLSGYRPREIQFVEGWWNDRAATLKVRGSSSGSGGAVWMAHLVRHRAEAEASGSSPTAEADPTTTQSEPGDRSDPSEWRLEHEWWLINEEPAS